MLGLPNSTLCIALCVALNCIALHYIAELLLFHMLVGQHDTVRYVSQVALDYVLK